MWFAHFECVVKAANAARFYRYEVEQGLYGGWHLTAHWGRIGRRGQRRQFRHSDQTGGVWAILRQEAQERFRHGYSLTSSDLPIAAIAGIDAVRPKLARAGRVDKRRAETLKRTQAILNQLPQSSERIADIDRLIDQIDPDRRRARANTLRKRREATTEMFQQIREGTPLLSDQCLEAAEVEARRDLFRLLSIELLADDPTVARGVLCVLDLPRPYETARENILPFHNRCGRIENWSLDQFMVDAFQRRSDPPRLEYHRLTTDLAVRLYRAGLRKVSDLVSIDLGELVAKAVLTEREVSALVRACTDYDLRLRYRSDSQTAMIRDVA